MKNRGFTLFIAIVVTGTLLLVAMGIIALAVKEATLSSTAKDSQVAFYAADTAMECALYWDVKYSTGISAFSTTTNPSIDCNYNVFDGSGNDNRSATDRSGTNDILEKWPRTTLHGGYMIFKPDPYCARFQVTKREDNSTLIEAFGYNTCDASNPRRVERAVRATY